MKTNIELAREAGMAFEEHYSTHPTIAKTISSAQLDRYTELVEARLLAKLLEGTGEPIKCIGVDEKDVDVYTTDQIAATVLRERREHKPNCKECGEWREMLAQTAYTARAINEGKAIVRRLAEDAIRNRGTK